jgi:hypothetical protein
MNEMKIRIRGTKPTRKVSADLYDKYGNLAELTDLCFSLKREDQGLSLASCVLYRIQVEEKGC